MGRTKGSKNKRHVAKVSGMVKHKHTCPCVKSRETGKCHMRSKAKAK